MARRSERSASGGSPFPLSFERFSTSSRADFRFAPLNTLALVGIVVAGLTAHLRVHGPRYGRLSSSSALPPACPSSFICARIAKS